MATYRDRTEWAVRLALLALLVLGLVVLAGPAAAQQGDADWLARCEDRVYRSDGVRHCAIQVERIPATGAPVTVDAGRNGGVSIRGWDGDDIEVHMRVDARADSEARARVIAEQVRIGYAGVEIRAVGPATDRGERWYAGFVIYVPRQSDVRLETGNGPLDVRNVHGLIDVRTDNGPLSIRDAGGEVRARTRNGPLSVQLGGSRWNGAGLDAESRNGPITLSIPDGYSARLEAGTVNGHLRTDVPLTVTAMGRVTNRIETLLGAGGPPVRVVTSNGPITIHRR